MNSAMQGRRLPDGAQVWEPGDYWFEIQDGQRVLYGCTPNGVVGNCARHEVTEHDDGTVTVSPSILVHAVRRPSDGAEVSPEWHGYLERGVWRSA